MAAGDGLAEVIGPDPAGSATATLPELEAATADVRARDGAVAVRSWVDGEGDRPGVGGGGDAVGGADGGRGRVGRGDRAGPGGLGHGHAPGARGGDRRRPRP